MSGRGHDVGNRPTPSGVLPDMLLRACLVALVLLSSCTSEDTPERTRSSAQLPSSLPSEDAEVRAVLEDYFGCLRDEGIDVGEPAFDDSGRVEDWPSYALTDSARSAEQACNGDLSEVAFRPRGEAAVFLERAGQFADCMAEHGVTDVEVSLEGIRIGPHSSNREINAAERECVHFVEPQG